MLAAQGLLTRAEAAAILRALDDIERGTDVPALTYTGEHEDFFFLVQTELERRLGVETAGKLHTGRSRNDIDHTVFKMALKERLVALLADLLQAIAALLEVAEANRATLVVAYTHGQPAQPTTYGHYLGALDRAAAPRRGAPASGEPLPGPLQHGRGGDHDVRLPARPRGDGGAPGLRRGAGQRLRLHRRQRLRHQRVRRAPAHVRPSRPVRPGPERVDGVRGRTPPRARRLRAGELDHAPEAEPGGHRAPAAPLLARRRPGRRDGRRRSTTRRSPT